MNLFKGTVIIDINKIETTFWFLSGTVSSASQFIRFNCITFSWSWRKSVGKVTYKIWPFNHSLFSSTKKNKHEIIINISQLLTTPSTELRVNLTTGKNFPWFMASTTVRTLILSRQTPVRTGPYRLQFSGKLLPNSMNRFTLCIGEQREKVAMPKYLWRGNKPEFSRVLWVSKTKAWTTGTVFLQIFDKCVVGKFLRFSSSS